MEQSTTSHFKLSATFCGTCDVRFDNPDTRRAHSKSQWHVTNLKRRIAELDPLTAEQHAAVVAAAPTSPTTEPSSEDSLSSASDVETDTEPDFVPEECLFCNAVSKDFEENVAHMHKLHGMFIPDKERLIVDLETLVRYLHLVVFGYRECLQCGTQRRTPAAVQQHMKGKNHCRFDIHAEDSEFRDFYEKLATDEEEAEQEGKTRKAIADAIEEGSSIRLPSGKTLSHRSAPAPSRPRRKLGESSSGENLLPEGVDVDESKASMQLTAPGKKNSSKALTRAEKREAVFETQLARLSANDRMALAHLPVAEQRSLLLTQHKQLQKAERAARRTHMRLQMKGNISGRLNLVDDVMGPKFMVGLWG
ncbi:Core trichothecene cluster (CTC) protein 15 [Colletotrichum sp. SAR 10_77]|nr:Core trichothecene cluster (CTC) protein 15 [Colletotrichum sp. SAR 10_76]KAI8243781.1 Core trichothecene cluster (CTC) protein 15 [Colletotrichum sp. SAR 10_77]